MSSIILIIVLLLVPLGLYNSRHLLIELRSTTIKPIIYNIVFSST